MIIEDYVSFETSKLLKEKGFKQWCRHCYGIDVRHNGKSISFDEECELKDEGFGDEIEYVEGGQFEICGYGNDTEDKLYAAPTLQMAMKWLREVHHYYIQVMLDDWAWACGGHLGYYVVIQKTDSDFEMMLQDGVGGVFYETYEQACESAIKYCIENLI